MNDRALEPRSARRRRIVCGAAALLVAMRASIVQALAPGKPLRVVVAGPAGGTADIVARLLADALTRTLATPVVVDPKPGAAGAIAVGEIAAAARDGHTLLVGVNSLVSEVPHAVRVQVDIPGSIVPLADLAQGGLVLVGHPSLPANTLAALIARARAHPGKLAYASYSPGTMSHILGLQLNRAAGIDLVHVGYKGSTPALADVMGGHVPLMFDGIPTSLPLISAGKLRAFAVSTPRRSSLLPQVPTFAELGYRELQAVAWLGLWAAPGVPAPIRAKLRDAALQAMAQPAQRERLRELGFEPGTQRTPDELAAALRADSERVAAMLKSIGYRPE